MMRTGRPVLLALSLAFLGPAVALVQTDLHSANEARIHVDADGNATLASPGGRAVTAQGRGTASRQGCPGGHLEVSGTGANISATGVCRSVELSGTRNTVHVRLSPDAVVEFIGTGNTLIWSPADPQAALPRIENIGTNNVARRD